MSDAVAGTTPNTGATPAATAAPATPVANAGDAGTAPAAAPADASQQATTGQDTLLQEGAKTDGEGTAKVGAPEKYEFTSPEGVTLDPSVMTDFEAVAKELDLPQEAAQKLVDKLSPKLAERTAAQFQQAIEATSQQWVAAVKADPEIGGDKLNENLSVAKKALDAFGTPELRALLNNTRLGNNPEVIRTFMRIGQAISEDNDLVPADGVPSAIQETPQQRQARALYGKPN